MKCPKCGMDIDGENALFCGCCGASLREETDGYATMSAEDQLYGYDADPAQGDMAQAGYPGQNDYAQTGYPGQSDYAQNGYPEQNDYAQNGYPGQNGYARNGYPGQNDYARNGYPGQNGYARNGYPGQYGYPQNGYPQYGDPRSAGNSSGSGNNKTAVLVSVIAAAICLIALGVFVVYPALVNEDGGSPAETGDGTVATDGADDPSRVSGGDVTGFVAETTEQPAQTTQPTAEEVQNSVDPDKTLPITGVTCSAHQPDGSLGRKFTPQMAVDGDPDTCWMANTDGQYTAGAGNWIKLDYGTTQTVHGIKLINGNVWDGYHNGEKVYDELFEKNGRIEEFQLTFSDGSYLNFTANDVKETSFGRNIFFFDRAVKTDYVILTVRSGYCGYKYPTVVCLAEVETF